MLFRLLFQNGVLNVRVILVIEYHLPNVVHIGLDGRYEKKIFF